MSTRSRRHDRCRQFDSAVLRRFRFEALKLPPAGDKWLRIDTEIDHAALVAFHKSGVVEKLHRCDDNPTRAYWETAQGVYEYAQDRFGDLDTTPCGHATGVRTLEAGETYTCTDESCDCRMNRETALEVVA